MAQICSNHCHNGRGKSWLISVVVVIFIKNSHSVKQDKPCLKLNPQVYHSENQRPGNPKGMANATLATVELNSPLSE